jgi:CDP-diacylglycerol--glycerol-3-phosphate 3-phosphatidyltransferase
MNLPNALTIGRIVATPAIAVLPFSSSAGLRLTAFVLFLLAAITDYVDGYLARSRKEETDFGRLLDPFADKALLVGTLTAMYMLAPRFPFITPLGPIGLPLWIVIVVLGREVFMTVFRQAAARRGVVISAIRSAKWKTGLQLVWQGAAYCWFWIATVAAAHHWENFAAWRGFALFNGTVGTLMMIGAVFLTLYSLVIYMRDFGRVFANDHVSS